MTQSGSRAARGAEPNPPTAPNIYGLWTDSATRSTSRGLQSSDSLALQRAAECIIAAVKKIRLDTNQMWTMAWLAPALLVEHESNRWPIAGKREHWGGLPNSPCTSLDWVRRTRRSSAPASVGPVSGPDQYGPYLCNSSAESKHFPCHRTIVYIGGIRVRCGLYTRRTKYCRSFPGVRSISPLYSIFRLVLGQYMH